MRVAQRWVWDRAFYERDLRLCPCSGGGAMSIPSYLRLGEEERFDGAIAMERLGAVGKAPGMEVEEGWRPKVP